MRHDPRLTPVRSDMAAESVRGLVDAPRYVTGTPYRVSAKRTQLLRVPGGGLDTELLHGEDFTVYDIEDGWAWGQCCLDGYVGYVDVRTLVEPGPEPTHRVTTLSAQAYRLPELKLLPTAHYPFGARLYVGERGETHAQVGPSSWIPWPQLVALDAPAPDWVAVAEMLVGVPYVWGGRSSEGIDCSGVVQLSLQATGNPCPRDSDQQQAVLGHTLPPGAAPKRGDLVFWKGHVGLMRDAETLLHANAHHMAVVTEPLDQAVRRIAANEFGDVQRRARLDPDALPA